MKSLISTDWLDNEIGANDLVILDATQHVLEPERDSMEEYQHSHIPTSQFFDLTNLIDERSNVPKAFPRREQLVAELARCGAGPSDRIVFYDDSQVKTSARAWFICFAHGIENISILDGGKNKWRSEKRPLSNSPEKPEQKALFSLPSAKRLFFKRDVLENIESKAAQLIDARSHRRFAGLENEIQGRSTGHIPFSSNLPFTMLFNEDGTYKSLDKLQAAFNQIGSEKDKPIITTCGSGVTACVLLFALHLIGYENTMLYDGSWLDWSLDEETPKVRFSA